MTWPHILGVDASGHQGIVGELVLGPVERRPMNSLGVLKRETPVSTTIVVGPSSTHITLEMVIFSPQWCR